MPLMSARRRGGDGLAVPGVVRIADQAEPGIPGPGLFLPGGSCAAYGLGVLSAVMSRESSPVGGSEDRSAVLTVRGIPGTESHHQR